MRSCSDLLEVRAGILNVSQRKCKVDYAGQAKCVASSDVNGVQQANVFGVHNSPCKEFLLTSYLQGKDRKSVSFSGIVSTFSFAFHHPVRFSWCPWFIIVYNSIWMYISVIYDKWPVFVWRELLAQELTELLNALGPDMFSAEAWP